MLERIGIQGELVFSGGVTKNKLLIQLLSEKLNRPVYVSDIPEIVGAYGAALHISRAA